MWGTSKIEDFYSLDNVSIENIFLKIKHGYD